MVKCDICHFTENPDHFAYCGRCGNGLSNSGSLSNSLISAAIEGERKQVTIIFADISGFTALNDAANTPSEVEKVLQIVNHCLQILSEVVYEYDGYIDKYMGDAIMAIFGAPRAHEDDPERALRVALAMRDRLEEFNQNPPFPLAEPLGIHLGINTGTVIAGLIGTKRKRSYTVMGDAVNVASRLEGVSERGEVLVSQDTYQLTNRLFLFKDREPVLVKGKKDALVIYELRAARSQRASQRGIAGLRAPMIGRQEQFVTFRNKVSNLTNNKGGIVVVSGEAGLGKSRLVNEIHQIVTEKTPDLLWLEGRSLSYRQNVSYRLFVEILGQFLGANLDESGDVLWQKWQVTGPQLFGDRHEEVTPYLATLMGIKLDEKITQNMPLSDPVLLQQRMFMAVGEWVESVAEQTPFVLVFEDLHWADPSSVTLIQYLMTISQHLPLLLICITRPEKAAEFWAVKQQAATEYENSYTELTLDPLSDEQSRSLVDQLLQVEQLPDVLESLILSRCEGNPLFMEEVLRSLIEDETLVKEGNSWIMDRPVTEINIPHTLTGVLTSRIDRLDEPVKRTLQIASVIGRVFSRSILIAVAEDLADDTAKFDEYLAMLVAAELIKERSKDADTEYIFKHVLIKETAYNTLLLQQRHIYHKRIADHMAPMYYLKGEDYASIIADHYEQGEVWPRALTYLGRAAEASKTIFDNINAVKFYSRALNISQKVEDLKLKDLITIYKGRGKMLKRLGKIDEARADFEQVLQLAEANKDLITQMSALGEIGKLNRQFSDIIPHFEQALDIARQVEDQDGIADTLNQLAEFKLNMGAISQTEACLNEALEIGNQLNNTHHITNSKDGLATILLHQGQISKSIQQRESIVKTWRDIGNYQGLMKTYTSLVEAHTWQANYTEIDKICEIAMELQDRTGDLNWAHCFRYYMARNKLAQGNINEAKINITHTIKIARQLGRDIWQAIGLAMEGYIYLLLGQPKQAFELVRQGAEIAKASGSPLWISRTNTVVGMVHQLNGSFDKAKNILKAEVAQMQKIGFVPDEIDALSILIESYFSQALWDELPAMIERLDTLLKNSDMKGHQAKALIYNAQLDMYNQNYKDVLHSLQQALDIAQALDDKLLEFTAIITMATAQIALDNKKQAKEIITDAKNLLTDIASTIEEEELRKSFLDNSPLVSQVEAIEANN